MLPQLSASQATAASCESVAQWWPRHRAIAREHPEQAVRACLGVLRLAGTYGKERLELACERALAAGVASSRYVERLLKADRRHPFLDAHAEDGLGEHGNLRGPAYYN